jgi:hypothetical protein
VFKYLLIEWHVSILTISCGAGQARAFTDFWDRIYRPIAYGEWTRPRLRNFREQCCDCGLIHRLDFRIVDGRIEFRTRRDDRATAAARRRFRFARQE